MDDVQSSTVVTSILSPQKKKLTSEKTREHQKGVRDYCFSPGSVQLLHQCLGHYVSVIHLNAKYLKRSHIYAKFTNNIYNNNMRF